MRRWGALVILAALWLGSSIAHYHWGGQVARHEAEQHGQQYDAGEHRDTWLAETFENYQSEWAQLLLQSLIIVAFANALFAKSKEDEKRLEAMVANIHERMAGMQASVDGLADELMEERPRPE